MGLTIARPMAVASRQLKVESWDRIWSDSEKLGGNADVFENKRVAKKAICKLMKMNGMQIDGVKGAICKLLKTKTGVTTANDNAESQRTRRCRRGTPPPA